MEVVLHNIRSIYNTASMFRTADAVGISKIYLCGATPAPVDRFGKYRPQFTKVSLGAEKTVSWEAYKETWRLLEKLKGEGYGIIAVEQYKKSTPYCNFQRGGRESIVLVLGSEVHGLPESVLRRADTILEIPMSGKKESLNVAVALGIVAFHLRDSGS